MRFLFASLVIATLAPVVTGASEPLVLQQRVDVLVEQVDLRYAADPMTRTLWRHEIGRGLSAWNDLESPSPADQQIMAQWLKESLDATMPGARGSIPAAPRFEQRSSAPSESQTARKPVSESDSSGEPQPRPVDRSEWSRHPASAPLDWVDPFIDDEEEPTANPLRVGALERRSLRPIVDEHRSLAADAGAAGVAIDLGELSRRLVACNAELRVVNQRLLTLNESTPGALVDAAERLAEIVQERSLLDVYLANLTLSELADLPNSDSSAIALELARRKLTALLQDLPQSTQALSSKALRERAETAAKRLESR